MYKFETDKMKIKPEHDRRIKLNDQQREAIREKYATGMYTQRNLAEEYGVSRRLISFVLDPDKLKKNAEQLKKRKADGRYKPTKEKWAAIQREHRQYKHQLYLKGELNNG